MRTHRMLHLAFVAGGVAACVLAIRGAVLVGYARSLAGNGEHNLSRLEEAARLSPNDPEIYIARANYAVTHGELEGAVADLQKATTLRPGDYRLWIQLGRLLEKSGRDDVAMEAFSTAAALAPFYATPPWEKAKLFQKHGAHDEAFAEFRKATLSNPALFKDAIEAAWETYAPDVNRTQSAVAPQDDFEKLSFAHFLIYHGKALEALPVIRSVAELGSYDRSQFLRYLIAQQEFTVAYELWSDAPPKTDPHPLRGSIPDGGFESGRISDDAGFAWTAKEVAATKVSIDSSMHLSGNRSLRIDWTGGPAPAEDVISLLVLVEPDTNYMLRFAARSQDVISGVAPVVRVFDANKTEGTKPSVELPAGASDWQPFSLAFKTGPSSNAIYISVQKQKCKDALCPVFGTHWLDDFVLSRII